MYPPCECSACKETLVENTCMRCRILLGGKGGTRLYIGSSAGDFVCASLFGTTPPARSPPEIHLKIHCEVLGFPPGGVENGGINH